MLRILPIGFACFMCLATWQPVIAQGAGAAARRNEVSRLQARLASGFAVLKQASESPQFRGIEEGSCNEPSCEAVRAASHLISQFDVASFWAPSGFRGRTNLMREAVSRVERVLFDLDVNLRGCGCAPPKVDEPSSLVWAIGVMPSHPFGGSDPGRPGIILASNLPGDVLGKVAGSVLGGSRFAEELKTRLTLDLMLPFKAEDRGRVLSGLSVGIISIGGDFSTRKLVPVVPAGSWPPLDPDTVEVRHRFEARFSVFGRSLPAGWFDATELEANELSEAESLSEIGVRMESYLTSGPGVFFAVEWSPGYYESRNVGDVLAKTVLADPPRFHQLSGHRVRIMVGLSFN